MLAHTVKMSKKGQIVVPREIRKALGIEPGKTLVILLRGNEAVLLPSEKYADYTRGMLKGTWGNTKEEVEKYIGGERDSWN